MNLGVFFLNLVEQTGFSNKHAKMLQFSEGSTFFV